MLFVLSFGKSYGDKSGLGYVENDLSSMGTKSKYVRKSIPVAPKVNPSSETRFIPTCHQCRELGHIHPKCMKLYSGKNDALRIR